MGTYEFMCVYMCVYVHAEDRGEVRCLILSLSTSVFEIEFLTKPKLAFLARLVGYQVVRGPPRPPPRLYPLVLGSQPLPIVFMGI